MRRFTGLTSFLILAALLFSACTAEVSAPEVTGFTGEGPVRLSDLLSKSVTAGEQAVGQVDGVLIEHPPAPAEEAGEGDSGTPAASEVDPATAVNDFFVRYLLVDVSGTEAAGDEGGQVVTVPWGAVNNAVNDAVTLGADLDLLREAPHVNLSDLASGSAAWSEEVSEFWSAQNVGEIPITGAEQAANLALVPVNFIGISIHDADGNELGTVSDLVFDPSTGQILEVEYLADGETVTVPFSQLTWEPDTGTRLGSFTLNQ